MLLSHWVSNSIPTGRKVSFFSFCPFSLFRITKETSDDGCSFSRGWDSGSEKENMWQTYTQTVKRRKKIEHTAISRGKIVSKMKCITDVGVQKYCKPFQTTDRLIDEKDPRSNSSVPCDTPIIPPKLSSNGDVTSWTGNVSISRAVDLKIRKDLARGG